MRALTEDIRYAVRRLRHEPKFVAFAVMIIGLGVAATTTVFSVLSPLMLRPLPFEEPGRLVWIAGGSEGGMSAVTSRTSNLRDYRELTRSFESLTGYFAFFGYESYILLGDGAPQRLTGVGVATNFLEVLGVQPMLGRNFVEEEGISDGRNAVILTHHFWRQRYGAAPDVVGRTITLNGEPTSVVGVLPASFDFASVFSPGAEVDFLRPFPISNQTDQWGNTLAIIGRLTPGATIEGAQAELDQINARLQEADPDRWGLDAVVTSLRDDVLGELRKPLWLLAAAAGLVLVIVCANLSNLLLARGERRTSEMALRSAFGASRHRILRQLVLESLLLSLTGGLIGVLISIWIVGWVGHTEAITIPLLESVSVDGMAVLFAMAVTVFTGLVIGILPALQLVQGGESTTLRLATSRSATQSKGSRKIREALVVGEVALACVLLVSGGLLLHSLENLLDIDLGFRPEGAVLWELNPSRDFENAESRTAFYRNLVTRIGALPGVSSVGLTDTPPLGRNRSWSVRPEGTVDEDGETPTAFPRIVDSSYLQAIGIPLLSGRGFNRADDSESRNVVVLNETAAERLFGDRDAIGRTIITDGDPWHVVGVVGDVRHQSIEEESGLEMYFPISQHSDFSSLSMVVRSHLPAEPLAQSVNAALHELDPAMPVGDYQPLQAVVDSALSARRFILSVLGAFAGTALLLSALGIYAVLSYSVTQRVREIGIRMALGESATKVQRNVVGRTLMLAGAGVLIGAIVSLFVSRVIQSLLYGLEPADPITFAISAITLLTVAALAGYLPARRASKTDPMQALSST